MLEYARFMHPITGVIVVGPFSTDRTDFPFGVVRAGNSPMWHKVFVSIERVNDWLHEYGYVKID